MSVQAAITALQTTWSGLSGVLSAPTHPPEAPGAFPFAVTYERAGELQQHSAGFGDELVTLYSEVHLARQLLPATIATALPLRDAFLSALIADPTLAGTVSTITARRWTFGQMEWGGTGTIGYRFEIDVKVPLTGG